MAEYQLSTKEDRIGKFLENLRRELGRLLHDVDADGCHGFRMGSTLRQVFLVTLIALIDVAPEILHFGGAFEIARIHHADLYEHEIFEHAREHALHAEQCVETQAVES